MNRLLALFSFYCLVAWSTPAATLVSSLGNTSPQTYVFPTNAWVASPFQTPTQTWTLASVTVLVGEGGADPTTATLQLHADNGGKPGALLADLGSPIIDSALSLRTFTGTGTAVTLNPSTTYWVALGASSASQPLSVGVVDSPPFTFTGAQGASMSFSASDGTGVGTNPPSVWANSYSGLALLFQVVGGPVVIRPYILPVTLSGTNLLVQFQSQADVTYVLQAAPGLENTPAWTDISTNAGTGGLVTVPVPVNSATPKEFFRLRVPPP